MKKTSTLLVFIIALLSTLAQAQVSADSALKSLKEGNKRFVEGKSIKPHQDLQRIKEVSSGQKPFAIIIGCSDSRVPNEIIFDQGLGDLFIIRTAGQVSTFASWGSIEFGNAVLGANLIVVMGHTKCGAVAAACQIPDVPGHIVTLINAIKPAAQLAKTQKGDEVENAVKINVAMQVQQLENLEPVLTKAVISKNLKIVGAVYNLETGNVDFLDPNYLQTLKK
ncbi:carbonic anhydrase [Flavobacterium micromati]|jgi:carbonic anhydrase|uniref:Carbonic anhydrase n=1 Tax=Flavobacterium micromati TaxID=229205 RepID=A0A1M5GL90_9FLAO|nr:carbonic anhydrase [Flavobacterium micromati]MCL6462125.1 carbonic anhydrase [Flavobacterium micromati]SHG04530.1 carbonic anhydrase [Flavobacterium micromati]